MKKPWSFLLPEALSVSGMKKMLIISKRIVSTQKQKPVMNPLIYVCRWVSKADATAYAAKEVCLQLRQRIIQWFLRHWGQIEWLRTETSTKVSYPEASRMKLSFSTLPEPAHPTRLLVKVSCWLHPFTEFHDCSPNQLSVAAITVTWFIQNYEMFKCHHDDWGVLEHGTSGICRLCHQNWGFDGW